MACYPSSSRGSRTTLCPSSGWPVWPVLARRPSRYRSAACCTKILRLLRWRLLLLSFGWVNRTHRRATYIAYIGGNSSRPVSGVCRSTGGGARERPQSRSQACYQPDRSPSKSATSQTDSFIPTTRVYHRCPRRLQRRTRVSRAPEAPRRV